mmetsp:Transcript_13115/g.29125  ORF Transcript_13115/g.29125 Transcript_13115/m.29125 type:complete len:426 (-) Transcript_13115:81-1358(-)
MPAMVTLPTLASVVPSGEGPIRLNMPRSWHTSAFVRMKDASKASDIASTFVNRARGACDATSAISANQAASVKDKFTKKVKSSSEIVTTLATASDEAAQAEESVKHSLSSLQTLLNNLRPIALMNHQNSQRRSQKPGPEVQQDSCFEALQDEREALEQCQQWANERIRLSQRVRDQLREMRAALEGQIQLKTAGDNVDRWAWDSARIFRSGERPPSFDSNDGRPSTKLGRISENGRKNDGRRLARATSQLCGQAQHTTQTNGQAQQRILETCRAAFQKVERTLQEAMRETGEVRARMGRALGEVEQQMQRTKVGLNQTEETMKDALRAGVINTRRRRIRKQRPQVELISDEVVAALDEESMHNRGCREELKWNESKQKQALNQLAENRQRLHMDIHNKSVSLQVDQTCFRLMKGLAGTLPWRASP